MSSVAARASLVSGIVTPVLPAMAPPEADEPNITPGLVSRHHAILVIRCQRRWNTRPFRMKETFLLNERWFEPVSSETPPIRAGRQASGAFSG
jgi:hypothetical protein